MILGNEVTSHELSSYGQVRCKAQAMRGEIAQEAKAWGNSYGYADVGW